MPVGSLWLPAIVSAIVVFVASSILHMVLKYHKADYKALPNEEVVRDAIAKGDPPPGVYVTPYCHDMKQMQEPAVKARYEKGPVAMLTILPKGLPVMPKLLGLWFGFSLLVSLLAACVARHVLHPGDEGRLVMKVTGSVAFAAYALSHVSDSIWKGQPWSNTVRAVFDGAIYALLTGLTFRMLWPAG
jgi:hypothetical protein